MNGAGRIYLFLYMGEFLDLLQLDIHSMPFSSLTNTLAINQAYEESTWSIAAAQGI